MSLTEKINADIKTAMLAKDKDKLEALRAVKSAILLLSTDKGAQGVAQEEAIIKTMQKLSKQRKEAAEIYKTQNRNDLVEVELFQASIIDTYLPKQMEESEVKEAIKTIISRVGAISSADMGKVMSVATKQLTGKADGKLISTLTKELLSGN